MKTCLDCGGLTERDRCSACRRTKTRAADARKRQLRPERTNAERNRRTKAVEDHVAYAGWTCPGYGVPPHGSRDLTADHVHPVAAGGREDGPLTVLCRVCNGRKQARTTP